MGCWGDRTVCSCVLSQPGEVRGTSRKGELAALPAGDLRACTCVQDNINNTKWPCFAHPHQCSANLCSSHAHVRMKIAPAPKSRRAATPPLAAAAG